MRYRSMNTYPIYVTLHFRDRGVVHLRSVRNLAEFTVLVCPIRHGFGVGTKAILCRVHIALVDQQGALHLYSINTFCSHFLY